MSKKYLQLPRFQTRQHKTNAISLVQSHVNEHLSEFKDGEEIVIEYLDPYDEPAYTTAVIKKDGDTAIIFAAVDEHETARIAEGKNEPSDKTVLWLADTTNEEMVSGETSNLREEIKSLKETIKVLQEMVNKHDYALSNTLAGGDIIANAEKFDLENKYEPEMPEDAEDPTEYAEDDKVITSFDVYVGNSSLSEFSGVDASLYRGQTYPLKFRFYNGGLQRVEEPEDLQYTFSCVPANVASIDGRILKGKSSGDAEVSVIVTTSGNTLSKRYDIHFEYNEEPDYETYEEPNVHHMLIKKADTEQIMFDNFNYLLIGEFCWCIKENTLYLKEKAANGTIQLFKINGGGSVIPTGETVTYKVDTEGIFSAESSDDSVNVTDGILSLVGTVDANGILILNDVNQ